MPHCKVTVDRVGDKWINTSQYPCGQDNVPGWSLAGKNVRGENQNPEVAPQHLP